jgi:glycosyltransferase involved in cell wall biosynthesis
MRINIATGPWLPVPAVQGGAVHRLWQGLAEEFATKGHQVSILCRSYPGQPNTEVINRVTYIRRGGLPQSTNIYWDLLKDFAYAATTFPTFPPADVTVINDFWLPIFATFRPSLGKIAINVNRFPKKQYWLYKKIPYFSAPSKVIKDEMLKEDPTAIDKIKIVPNPIDTNIFSPPSTPRSNDPDKTILYVGRLHPEKGVHLLLEAFALLCQQNDRANLIIVGPIAEHQGGGGDDYLAKLKALAEGLPIRFLDPVFDPEKLANIYRQADLFCYPSLAEKGESFGVAPLEAMATGLVPIVSSLECFTDFIVDCKTGYFFNHRTPDAAKNLAYVLNLTIDNWDRTMEVGVNANQAAQSFSYQHVAQLYLADFAKLISTSISSE